HLALVLGGDGSRSCRRHDVDDHRCSPRSIRAAIHMANASANTASSIPAITYPMSRHLVEVACHVAGNAAVGADADQAQLAIHVLANGGVERNRHLVLVYERSGGLVVVPPARRPRLQV